MQVFLLSLVVPFSELRFKAMMSRKTVIILVFCVSAVVCHDRGSFAGSKPINSANLDIGNRNDPGSEQQVYHAPTTKVYQDFQPGHHIGFGDQGVVVDQATGSQQQAPLPQQSNINSRQPQPTVAPIPPPPAANSNNIQPQPAQQNINPPLNNNNINAPNQQNQQQQPLFPNNQFQPPQFGQGLPGQGQLSQGAFGGFPQGFGGFANNQPGQGFGGFGGQGFPFGG